MGNYLRSGSDPNNLYPIDRFTNLGGLLGRSANLGTFTLVTNATEPPAARLF